jgi:hypothetical protein
MPILNPQNVQLGKSQDDTQGTAGENPKNWTTIVDCREGKEKSIVK